MGSSGLFGRIPPRDYDPAAWTRTARDAGMRYLVFTTKHLFDAFRREGFMIGASSKDIRLLGVLSASR